MATEQVGDDARRFTDPGHIRMGLHVWKRAAVAEFLPGGIVVGTSAGAGREVEGLLAFGFDDYGFEPNAALVAAG